ncbi:MAG: hypothetical protein AABZ60_13250 [Planctomycetota bacterium]
MAKFQALPPEDAILSSSKEEFDFLSLFTSSKKIVGIMTALDILKEIVAIHYSLFLESRNARNSL